MKRIVLYFGMAVALVASCSTREMDFQTPLQDDVVFYASFEQPAENGTRVYANEDLLLRWTADDRVSIFNKVTYNQEYKFTGETGDNGGTFSKVGDEFATGNTISHIVSVYPYQKSTKISENENLTIELPAEQHYAENTFGLGANTMVSVTSDNLLQYKNVGGYLVLKLYGEGVSVSSISLKGNNGEKLAGKANVSMPVNGVPTMTMANDATSEIILTCATPVQLGTDADNSTQFWFVVPPVTFSKGFTVLVNGTSGGVFEKSTTKSITIERNKLSKMSQMEVELSGQPNNEIWYTTNDGNQVQLLSSDFGALIVSHEYKDGKGVITFDDDVTKIGDYAFGWSWNLTTVSLPDSVVSIGDFAFSGSQQLTSVSLPKSLKSVGRQAFNQCGNLTNVTIPESVTSIGEGAFAGCSSLTSFSGKYASEDGLYLLDGGTLLAAAAGSIIGDIILPSCITDIQGFAFENCSKMTSILLPEGLTNIGYSAFLHCGDLESIYIPGSVTSIEDGAFSGCSSLTSFSGKYSSSDGLFLIDSGNLLAVATGAMIGDIEIPSGIISIQYGAFSYCKQVRSIILPDGLTNIGPQAFSFCSELTDITIPNSVSSIGTQAFLYCESLTTIDLPNSLNSIEFGTFEYCTSLSNVNIPWGVRTVGSEAFTDCISLHSITLPNSVTSIDDSAFFNCTNLSNISLSNNLTSIGEGAFDWCRNLNSINIPESVIRIGAWAFANCSSLHSIVVFPQIPPSGGASMFDDRYNNCPIYVPAQSIDAYKSAQYWSDYADRIQAIPSSTPVPEAVDLGLSVKWASFNLGATKPEEYGDYYAWGETEPYYSSQNPLSWKVGKDEGYAWASYKWCMGSSNTMTKYCSDSSYGYNGFTDTKTVLDPEDDAVHVNLGGDWRMPTDAEWEELLDNCTWTWTTLDGVYGRLVTASNGNSIFLPAAGSRGYTDLDVAGSYGYYWSSSLNAFYPCYALRVSFSSDSVSRYYNYRYFGRSVRPVKE